MNNEINQTNLEIDELSDIDWDMDLEDLALLFP